MIKLVLLLGSVFLEIATLVWAFTHSATWASGFGLVCLHALASSGCAWLVHAILPQQCREPRRPIFWLLFLLAFFLPLVGALGLLVAMKMVQRWPSLLAQDGFRALARPEFTLQGDHVEVRFGAGGVRARLADHKASAESRLEALLAIKAMPQRLSSSILRALLDDPEEDLRLLAYGMLDTEEKNINQQINLALDEYRLASDNRAEVARKLASLYWELIYQNLAQGDVRLYALQEAARYAGESLQQTPDDAGLWVLLGKIHNAAGNWSAAEDSLLRAQDLGYPASRLVPYLAEHAFRLRRFDQVKVLLQSLDLLSTGDRMQPLTHYWGKPT